MSGLSFDEAVARAAERGIGGGPDSLGVAVTEAWLHDLAHGQIPLELVAGEPGARTLPADDQCPYVFVHAPIRRFRNDREALVAAGVFTADVDERELGYHEDGLVAVPLLPDPGEAGLSADDLSRMLTALCRTGALRRVELSDSRIRISDPQVEESLAGEAVHVVVRLPDPGQDRDAVPESVDEERVWDYLRSALTFRRPCNFCSVAGLHPGEMVVGQPGQAERTVRGYRFGATFAPVGDPRTLCHVLGWDAPPPAERVLDMGLRTYSFGDLIRLVLSMTEDQKRFAATYSAQPPPMLTGVCNHWAGNSIFHQHYQFLRARLPLLDAPLEPDPVAVIGGLEVHRTAPGWPGLAYVLRDASTADAERLAAAADALARLWQPADAPPHRTLNTVAAVDDRGPIAILVPRDRRRLTTSDPGNAVQKANAAVLELAGYFVVDTPADFEAISHLDSERRAALAASWLAELTPDRGEIAEFEQRLGAS